MAAEAERRIGALHEIEAERKDRGGPLLDALKS